MTNPLKRNRSPLDQVKSRIDEAQARFDEARKAVADIADSVSDAAGSVRDSAARIADIAEQDDGRRLGAAGVLVGLAGAAGYVIYRRLQRPGRPTPGEVEVAGPSEEPRKDPAVASDVEAAGAGNSRKVGARS